MVNLRIETKEDFKASTIHEFPVQNKYLNIFIDKEYIDCSYIDLLEVNLNAGHRLATGNLHLTNLEQKEFKPVVDCPEWIPTKKIEYSSGTLPEAVNLDLKLEGVPLENTTASGFDISINLGDKVIKPNKAKLIIERNEVPYLELRIALSDLSVNLNANFNIITEE